MAKDELVRKHHQFNGNECEQTLGDSEGHGNLACCNPWGSQKVGHVLATEQQMNNNLPKSIMIHP